MSTVAAGAPRSLPATAIGVGAGVGDEAARIDGDPTDGDPPDGDGAGDVEPHAATAVVDMTRTNITVRPGLIAVIPCNAVRP
jgi:hypothetical protein